MFLYYYLVKQCQIDCFLKTTVNIVNIVIGNIKKKKKNTLTINATYFVVWLMYQLIRVEVVQWITKWGEE